MLEMRIVLRELLCRVEFEPIDAVSERQRVKHFALVPHHGARISVGSAGPS
jgi:cytochrome P450